MTLDQITELISALYVLATLVGHLPFIPANIAAFCNRIALNLKVSKNEK